MPSRVKKNRLLQVIGVLALALVPLSAFAAPPVINNLTQSGNTYGSGSIVQAYKGIVFAPLQINASNTPTSYTATPLPAGLTLNATTGAVTGTPTAPNLNTTATIHAVNGDGTSTANVTLIFHVNDTTYNAYTNTVQPTPTPGETPAPTPTVLVPSDPGAGNVGDGVTISNGAYIPNTPDTRHRLNVLLQNGGVLHEYNWLGHQPNSAPGLKGDVGATVYAKTQNWDGIQNTACQCWHKVGTADTDWQDYND